MIFVLFGPPGVGKTYIGHLLSRELECAFFDADTIITKKETELLRKGEYSQSDRDNYVDRLTKATSALYDYVNRDLILAEAFPKIKNREGFSESFGTKVVFVNVSCPKEVAKTRLGKRLKDHVINERAFDLIWEEFENENGNSPKIVNYNKDDQEIIDLFDKIISNNKEDK